MDALIKRLEKFEDHFSRWHKDTVVAGNIPSKSSEILASIEAARMMMGSPLQRVGDNRFRLCDLGAGLGRVVALAAASGVWSYGFEINKKVAKGANKNLARNKDALGCRGVVYHASFYSKEFLSFYESPDSLCAWYEKNNPDVKRIMENARFPISGEPSFPHIANQYTNTDIFYLYPWSELIPSGIELFNLHASSGASLILNTYEPPYLHTYAKDLGLDHTKFGDDVGQFHILRKR